MAFAPPEAVNGIALQTRIIASHALLIVKLSGWPNLQHQTGAASRHYATDDPVKIHKGNCTASNLSSSQMVPASGLPEVQSANVIPPNVHLQGQVLQSRETDIGCAGDR